MVRLIKVTGESLKPLYQEGDFVLISKVPFLFGRLHAGDVVVFRRPEYGTLIKLVEDVQDGGRQVSVVGVGKGSVDSRRFGPVMRQDLLGKVIWHIRNPANGRG